MAAAAAGRLTDAVNEPARGDTLNAVLQISQRSAAASELLVVVVATHVSVVTAAATA